MLAPGNSSASPISGPAATMGVGHPAKIFLAAAISAPVVNSAGPVATASMRTFRATICFTPGISSTRVRSVSGPAATIRAF